MAYHQGQFDEALDHFKKALKIDKDPAEFHLWEGKAMTELKQYDGAVKTLSQLIKDQPELGEAQYELCNAYRKKGYYTVAIRFCEKGLELMPKDVEVMNRLAWLYAKKRMKLDEGLALSQKTLKRFPDKADFIDTLSEIYFARGNKEKAVEHISRALELEPDSKYYKQQLWRFENNDPPTG